MGSRYATLALCCCAVIAAGRSEAQETAHGASRVYWSADVSASAILTPGIGQAATGFGGSGSFSLVRSRDVPAEARTTCVGARVTFAQQWSDFGLTDGTRREQWLVAGPVLEMHETYESLFASLHPFAGIKRAWTGSDESGGSDVFSSAFGVRLSIGAGIAPIGGNEAAVHLFDITYLVAPADPVSRHRLLVSFGLDVSRRFGR